MLTSRPSSSRSPRDRAARPRPPPRRTAGPGGGAAAVEAREQARLPRIRRSPAESPPPDLEGAEQQRLGRGERPLPLPHLGEVHQGLRDLLARRAVERSLPFERLVGQPLGRVVLAELEMHRAQVRQEGEDDVVEGLAVPAPQRERPVARRRRLPPLPPLAVELEQAVEGEAGIHRAVGGRDLPVDLERPLDVAGELGERRRVLGHGLPQVVVRRQGLPGPLVDLADEPRGLAGVLPVQREGRPVGLLEALPEVVSVHGAGISSAPPGPPYSGMLPCFLGGIVAALGPQLAQGAHDLRAGPPGLDHLVDEAELGRLVGVRELLAVLGDLRGARPRRLRAGLLDLAR